jgi:hypothetical protein
VEQSEDRPVSETNESYTGRRVDDLELTNEKGVIPFSEFKILYPQVPDSLIPIVPAGTKFDTPGIVPVKPQRPIRSILVKKIL